MKRKTAANYIAANPSAPKKARLTPRQLEISRLVKTGLTDRQIGKMLGISPHTVSAHLQRVFLDFNISKRVQLVRLLDSMDGKSAITPREREDLMLENFGALMKEIKGVRSAVEMVIVFLKDSRQATIPGRFFQRLPSGPVKRYRLLSKILKPK